MLDKTDVRVVTIDNLEYTAFSDYAMNKAFSGLSIDWSRVKE